MENNLPQIEVEDFRTWLISNTTQSFETTANKKPFTYSIDHKNRIVITSSLGNKRNPISEKDFLSFTKKYNTLRDLTLKHYIGHNRSYLTTLLNYYISSKIRGSIKIAPEGNKSGSIDDVLSIIKVRQGQTAFRASILKEFDYKCAITGCSIKSILEAAHIVPHSEESNYDSGNGLLLRADIHTLYDMDLLRINEKGQVFLDDEVKFDEAYFKQLKGSSIASDLLTPMRKKQLKQRYLLEI